MRCRHSRWVGPLGGWQQQVPMAACLRAWLGGVKPSQPPPSRSCHCCHCCCCWQAADRILLISETRQAVNPALRVPAATSSEQGEGEAAAGARPDLALQHVKLPQQYIEAAYPLVSTAVQY